MNSQRGSRTVREQPDRPRHRRIQRRRAALARGRPFKFRFPATTRRTGNQLIESATTLPNNQPLIDPSWPSYAEMCRGEKARTPTDTKKLCCALLRWYRAPGIRGVRRYVWRLAYVWRLHEAGLSNREIAKRIGWRSEGTVRHHLGHGREYMAELVRWITSLPMVRALKAVDTCAMLFSRRRPPKAQRGGRLEWWLNPDGKTWREVWFQRSRPPG